MYFDKEKDVVMPMHPVHYQYVKLLEELLAEAGFEYQARFPAPPHRYIMCRSHA